jgi:hypothetical protein
MLLKRDHLQEDEQWYPAAEAEHCVGCGLGLRTRRGGLLLQDYCMASRDDIFCVKIRLFGAKILCRASCDCCRKCAVACQSNGLPQVDLGFGQLQCSRHFTSDEVGNDVSSCLQHSMHVLVHMNRLERQCIQFNRSYIID